MFHEDDLDGRVVTDRAVEVTTRMDYEQHLPRYDSGCVSGGLSSLGSPRHVSRDYQRLDSGICERMNEVRISETEEKEKVLFKSPQSLALEYYDTDSDGDCQLHLAIAEGVTEVVFALIKMAPHPNYLDIQNNELYAPLHIAVLVNQPRMVRRLVVAGATTNIRDREGNTPLHLAAKRGFKECAVALLSPISTDELREANINTGANPSNLHSVLDLTNYNGEHCVHLATFGQHYEFLWFLNLHRADINAMEGRSGKTALHYAVNMGDEKLVRLLALPGPSGAGAWINSRDWAGRTALQCAKINGDENIFRLLSSIPGCDTSIDESDEDFEFDTDEEISDYDRDYTDIEVNGMRIVESTA